MSKGKRIWIRADANERIASGHLARTLTIARELRRMGAEVRFVLADERSREWFLWLTKENWEISVLGIPYGTPERELPLLSALAEKERPDWILTDSYAVTADWFPKLREALGETACTGADQPSERQSAAVADRSAEKEQKITCAGNGGPLLACIDDERAFDPEVDLVINYDPDPENLEQFYHAAPLRLLGPQYAPLREQFMDREPVVRPVVRRMLISTGGTDPFGMAERLREILCGSLEECLKQAKTSERNGLERNAEEDRTVAQYHGTRDNLVRDTGDSIPALELAFLAPGYPRVEKVADLFAACDLAVSAAGTTLYELCASGVPTLAFAMADNQALFARQMAAKGAVTYLGDIRNEAVRTGLAEKVTDWILARSGGEEPESGLRLRQQESMRMHALTDGLGSRRIARAMLEAH